MKKIYPAFILFLLVQIPFKTFAQCNPAIPANANVVDSTQTVNGGFTPQWVCKNDTLFSGGGIFFVYLESNAVMSTGGGIDSIYVKDGATLIMNGGIHVILHEPLAVLNVTGGIPTYYPCNSITYDYANAPLNGCLVTSIPEENINSAPVSISPNPFADEITINTGFENGLKGLRLFDLFGREVLFKPAQTTIKQYQTTLSTSALLHGIYFIEINFQEERMVRKIVKQ